MRGVIRRGGLAAPMPAARRAKRHVRRVAPRRRTQANVRPCALRGRVRAAHACLPELVAGFAHFADLACVRGPT
ncbi:hypothetical protein DM45_3307 [Burkholderia mallei]|nr:hypothetical protein DM45_3307 [Burkholderia mallei]KOT11326.1 hypothetical protein DM77_2802 [Burkholderia mallei]